ncbi:hypothetical protein QBC43DRAFT_350649 [Cladorrhinum sp. PSN259]|nr:hypothetical protein QBC43DRAFT_350649 [Cladorrhinum sp. PSN259]
MSEDSRCIWKTFLALLPDTVTIVPSQDPHATHQPATPHHHLSAAILCPGTKRECTSALDERIISHTESTPGTGAHSERGLISSMSSPHSEPEDPQGYGPVPRVDARLTAEFILPSQVDRHYTKSLEAHYRSHIQQIQKVRWRNGSASDYESGGSSHRFMGSETAHAFLIKLGFFTRDLAMREKSDLRVDQFAPTIPKGVAPRVTAAGTVVTPTADSKICAV